MSNFLPEGSYQPLNDVVQREREFRAEGEGEILKVVEPQRGEVTDSANTGYAGIAGWSTRANG